MPRNNIPTDTTGLKGLDEALGGVFAGECAVWDVEDLEAYRLLARAFGKAAKRDGRRLVYFRFATHGRLLDEGEAEEERLDPAEGFEAFLHRVRDVLGGGKPGTYCLFDCLSALPADWCSDAMLVNFFLLTVPAVSRRDAVAWFGLSLDGHSRHAVEAVRAAVPLFCNVYKDGDGWLVLPVRAAERRGPELHYMRAWDGGERFELVRSSAVMTGVAGRVLPKTLRPESYARAIERRAGEWWRRHGPGGTPPDEAARAEGAELKRRLMDLILTRDASIRPLAEKYFGVGDLLSIRMRRIGTGLIGGKAVGMLLARRIAAAECPGFAGRLEPHDSFYIGSDVFYSFLVRNGLWEAREKQFSPESFLDGVDEARERVLNGKFSSYELGLFARMLDYFGPYPVIVRSSSLLEDAYGNSFAGKYESVFCANQGSPEERLRGFLDAIREVYASSMSREALCYRERNGLLQRDEQMALLVMRVSGELQGRKFLPHLAGVGFSYNPFAWDASIDPEAGVLRLVYGLGTRAVDRVDDDYTRVVALNAPLRRPEADFDEIARHSQRKVDYVDLDAGRLKAGDFQRLAAEAPETVPLDLFAPECEGGGRFLTFGGLLEGGTFVGDMRQLLRALQDAYGRPVDVEFAVNFDAGGNYALNLLQCRPLQVRGARNPCVPAVDPGSPAVVAAGEGAVVGVSRVVPLDWVLLVRPDAYAALGERDRHGVARAVGAVNRAIGARGDAALAVGPGRWGTRLPALGVPAGFTELGRFAAICELMQMHEFLTPDVSLGTHFFGELVESDLLYFAVFPGRGGNRWDAGVWTAAPNRLAEVAPSAAAWSGVLQLVDARNFGGEGLTLVADTPARRVAIVRGSV